MCSELKEQVKALGKTLIEELEKAAQQKELLDREIEAINQEKALITSALKTCQEENEVWQNECCSEVVPRKLIRST